MNLMLLNEKKNYKEHFDETTLNMFRKYLPLVKEYLIECRDSIFIKNEGYNKYVINKGVMTIEHVFIMLLLYTKNVNLVQHHCQKSLYYYIEFIGQIGDDNHTCLQLNSKDACLFVYKKTIFDIDNDYRKEFKLEKDEKCKLQNIELLVKIYNSNLMLMVNDMNINDEVNFVELIETTLEKIVSSCQFGNIKDDDLNERLNMIKYFSDFFEDKTINRIQYIELFIKKIKKMNDGINLETFKNNLFKNKDMLSDEITPQKYINGLFN